MIIPKIRQDSRSVADHYDDLDPFYRQLWGDHLHHGYWKKGSESQEEAVKNLIDLVASIAEVKKQERVCDIGCGYGGTSRFLADKWEADVTGFTLSNAQYQYALNAKSEKTPRYFLRNWLDNQMPEGSFEIALSIESSEHMEDKPRFFHECSRILAPQGRLVICAWIAKEGHAPWEEKYLLEPICREGRLPSMGTCTEYQNWMREAGFENVRMHDISKQVRKTWALCAGRILKRIASDQKFRKMLRDRGFKDRIFALTVFRLLAAYYTGSMRYIVFSGIKN